MLLQIRGRQQLTPNSQRNLKPLRDEKGLHHKPLKLVKLTSWLTEKNKTLTRLGAWNKNFRWQKKQIRKLLQALETTQRKQKTKNTNAKWTKCSGNRNIIKTFSTIYLQKRIRKFKAKPRIRQLKQLNDHEKLQKSL